MSPFFVWVSGTSVGGESSRSCVGVVGVNGMLRKCVFVLCGGREVCLLGVRNVFKFT